MRLDMRDWQAMKTLVRSRLLSMEHHKLDNLPKIHIEMDMCQCFYLALPAPDGIAPWDITCELMRYWHGVDVDTLAKVAEENMKGTERLMKMSDVLGAYMNEPVIDDSPLYIVTTEDSFYGASAILSKDIQKRLDDLFPSGCYVMPSSLHEMLVLSADGQRLSELQNIVRSINRSGVVAEQDILSDYVMKYQHGSFSPV